MSLLLTALSASATEYMIYEEKKEPTTSIILVDLTNDSSKTIYNYQDPFDEDHYPHKFNSNTTSDSGYVIFPELFKIFTESSPYYIFMPLQA